MKCQFCGKKVSLLEGIFGESACDDCAKEGQTHKDAIKRTKRD